MTEPFLTLLDHTTQWVFNKTFLYRQAETNHRAARPSEEQGATVEDGGQYLQLVISASYDLIPRSRQEIIELCRRELAEVLPLTREAQLRKATVIKEVNATFSPEPGSDRWRPAQRDSAGEFVFVRRLDAHGMAGDDGRRGAQWIFGGGGGAGGSRNAAHFFAAGFTVRRVEQILGRP